MSASGLNNEKNEVQRSHEVYGASLNWNGTVKTGKNELTIGSEFLLTKSSG